MVAINLLKTMQSSSMNIAVLQQRVCLGPMLLTTKKSSVDHSWILIQQGNRTVQVSSLLVFNNLRNPCCILPPFYCMIWYVPVFTHLKISDRKMCAKRKFLQTWCCSTVIKLSSIHVKNRSLLFSNEVIQNTIV